MRAGHKPKPFLFPRKECDAFETLHFIQLGRDGFICNFATLEECLLCFNRISHKEKWRKNETRKNKWRLTVLSCMINVFKEQKLINRCSIAFHVIQLSFFLGFLLCSLSCWYSMIFKRKRSCVITMK